MDVDQLDQAGLLLEDLQLADAADGADAHRLVGGGEIVAHQLEMALEDQVGGAGCSHQRGIAGHRVAGRSLGLQFHPEVTTEIMDDWVRVYRHELDGDGVDPDALLEETHRIAGDSRARAWQLFERFLHEVAGIEASHVAEAEAGG